MLWTRSDDRVAVEARPTTGHTDLHWYLAVLPQELDLKYGPMNTSHRISIPRRRKVRILGLPFNIIGPLWTFIIITVYYMNSWYYTARTVYSLVAVEGS
ncbi:hypothetical protein M422DRAFT_265672 [Sphaerobolus stellatus SS14]|uniref:Uncharacterized protein n=1 Tax=Sphaerobolus stellatus (strain SS14) TaxID=990650 RepID=A0A0C9UTE7_SPHS4|nr:hypothetical protein M422DRAFT_265672 [Sphaerobolus stellatus SS14]